MVARRLRTSGATSCCSAAACLRCPSSSMELENIVANTVLLKAREGERAAGVKRRGGVGGNGRTHGRRDRSIPVAVAPPRSDARGGGGGGRAPAGLRGGSRRLFGVPCGRAGVGSGSVGRRAPGRRKIPLSPAVRGGLGKEVNEIAEITIFTHLFLPPYPPPSQPPFQIWSHRLCYFSVYC